MKVRYIGDPNAGFDGPVAIEEAGEVFVKGEWKTVDDDHPRAAKLRGNPTFEVAKSSRPKAAVDPEGDVEELRAELDKLGVKYSEKAKASALRDLLVKNALQPEGEVQPPVPAT